MLATYGSAALICVASLLVGRALMRILGRDERSWLEGPVGLALLLLTCSLGVRLPGRTSTALLGCAVLVIASLVILRGKAIPSRRALVIAAPALVLTILAASLPFILSGQIGVLGVGINNDLAAHLDWTSWLRDRFAGTPQGIGVGYPIGPHALAATVNTAIGGSPLQSLLGLVLALPVLTALASLNLLGELSAPRRAIGATLVALPYLLASNFGLGSFKELALGLFILAFALLLREAVRERERRIATLVAIGVVLAGTTSVYSYPGLYWMIATASIWAVIELVAAWRRGSSAEAAATLRRAAPLVAIGVVVLLIAAIGELPRLSDFRDAGSVAFVQGTDSKLRYAVSPFEALGAWPSAAFLQGTAGLSASFIFSLIGLAGLAFGVAAALARREYELLAGLGGVALIYLGTVISGGLYVQSKALAVAAPLAMLVIVVGLLGREQEEGLVPEPAAPDARRWPPPRFAAIRIGVAIVFIGVAAYSSFLTLRDVIVAPETRSAELDQIRPIVAGSTVLSLSSDRYTDYYLRGAWVGSPARNAENRIRSRPSKDHRLPVDFDTPLSRILNRFHYALTTSSAYQSAPPSNYTPVLKTQSWVLLKRDPGSQTVPRQTLIEEERPGAVAHCERPKALAIIKRKLRLNPKVVARVQPETVVGKRLYWEPDELVGNGGTITQTLDLPPGRWQISIQYYSPVLDLHIKMSQSGGGDVLSLSNTFETTLPASADAAIPHRTDQGPFWPVATLRSFGKPVEVTVEAGGLSWFQRLLGVDQQADVGNITAARPLEARLIPFKQVCGHYTDHYYAGDGEPVDRFPGAG